MMTPKQPTGEDILTEKTKKERNMKVVHLSFFLPAEVQVNNASN